MGETPIHGFCDERFAAVREAFEENFRQGLELGASFALALEGEMRVDLWAGHADRPRRRAWQQDTITQVYSTTKIATSLCGLIALDRGLFELDEPVARYWPEFGAAGKAEIPVRQLFCHAAGVPSLDPPIRLEDLMDWEGLVARLAAQAPWWEPGTQSGYHSFSYVLLIGELIRRTSGRMPDRFLREEVTDRCGADFQFGLRDADAGRTAESDPVGERKIMHGSWGDRAIGWVTELAPLDDPVWNRMPIHACTNARALVTLGSILACGGSLRGQRFLSAETARLAYEEQIYTHDLVLDLPVRYGLGFGLASKEFPIPFPHAFHWGGYGGSSLIMEPDAGACWSYVPNRLDPAEVIDPRGTRLIAAACAALARLGRGDAV